MEAGDLGEVLDDLHQVPEVLLCSVDLYCGVVTVGLYLCTGHSIQMISFRNIEYKYFHTEIV